MAKGDASQPRAERATSRIQRTLTMIGKRKVNEKKGGAKAALAIAKENVAVAPKGANFAPTPVEDWGKAVVKDAPPPSPRAAERARAAKRKKEADAVANAAAAAEKPKLAEPTPFSPTPVRSFDWEDEQTLLDDWSLAFNGSRPLQLSGKVYNNAGPGLEDGDAIEYTSQIISVKGRVATTKSGTKYYLGEPAAHFEAVRVQLCRAAAAAERGPAAAATATASLPLDKESPFDGIDLGPRVPCSSVKLPAVAGWTAESNVALLHDWKLGKNAEGYNTCIGTVFNCPGEYDGTKGYQTEHVVEIQGRVMQTVDHRSFYLGRRASGEASIAVSAPAIDEQTELGEIDDLLSV